MQQVAITGTVFNPRRFEMRFEAVSSLLSLFDLQEKVNNQLQFIISMSEGSGVTDDSVMNDEDYSDLTTMQSLLEKVIEDSCNYVSWSLAGYMHVYRLI